MVMIQFVLDEETISSWQRAFAALDLNRYEGQALRAYFEEMRHLLKRRDEIDKLRLTLATDPSTGRQTPDEDQQVEFYTRTKAFYDTFYGALSHLSSVVSRFSRVFGGVAYSDNKPFLKWLERFSESASPRFRAKQAFEHLEASRLFRAVLNHPQQFQVPDWMTETRSDYPLVHIVMYGPQSRAGVIPEGSRRDPLLKELDCDWRMDAPDEVNVTNCLSIVSGVVLAAILAARSPGATFFDADESMRRAVEVIQEVSRQVRPGANVALPKPIVF